MAFRTPPLLEPYLRLPHEASLILLSGVLGSSTNWLVARHLHSLLASQAPSPSESADADGLADHHHHHHHHHHQQEEGQQGRQQQHTSVVFASFLRDYAFWKHAARRLGLDLDAARAKGSFVFVDGLTGLFMPTTMTTTTTTTISTPDRRHPQPQPIDDETAGGGRVLVAATTDHLRRTLEDAVAHVQTRTPGTRTVLVIDQPDLLIAAAGDAVSAHGLRDTILSLRERVYACIITVSADEPLIAAQTTPLEKEHASLTLSLAHDAHLIMSLRVLETGTAKDVSGVLRVTPGGDEGVGVTSIEDRELLYFIGGDGSVRVFERGQ
ncbi:hypothetical protein F4802DRAFT_611017 [Xylaria palmicola]|nr:hypothetical protein F4802DRAFT_611017 [Xylaria palmicola]